MAQAVASQSALSIIGFPIERLLHSVMAEILRGGMDVLKEAGTILLGGHSIHDEEIKFGFAVTGLVTDSAVVTNAGAQPGDVLVLTKPLGTGIVSLANQIGKASPEMVRAAEISMSSLNRAASEVMVRHHATAATDITGFGFLGHLCQVVLESGVTAEIGFAQLPLLPNVMDLAEQGVFSGAAERNSEYSAPHTEFADNLTEAMKAILYDAQTSGGLLMALPSSETDAVLKELNAAGISQAAIVGRIAERSDGIIRVCREIPGVHGLPPRRATNQKATMTKREKPEETSCCEHSPESSDQPLSLFQDFMGKAMAPGAVDVVNKELIAIALALAVHCVSCSKIHIKKAKSMGISTQEIEEAAALAVAFAGCRTLMLWNELKKELLS